MSDYVRNGIGIFVSIYAGAFIGMPCALKLKTCHAIEPVVPINGGAFIGMHRQCDCLQEGW